MKVAIVHDYLNQYGGGERVVEVLHEIWPDAQIYTSLFDKKLMGGWLKIPFDKIHTNFVSKLPFSSYLQKHYFFAYPLAFRVQNVGDVDVVISSSSYAAKFIKIPSGAVHICYLHTPPRFLWGYDTELSRYYHRSFDKFLSPLYKVLVPSLKKPIKYFDYKVSQSIDFFIANSLEVKKRIKKNYDRDSIVINPPVDTKRFKVNKIRQDGGKGYFLVVSRLGGYKKIDIVVEAFNDLKKPLKVVGLGPQFEYLKSISKDNIKLLGRQPDETVTRLIEGCIALVFPTHEDFGIVPVEAMAAGKPVIAFRKGGALETVKEGVTGEFFDRQTPDAIMSAVKKFKSGKYKPQDCRKQAEKFSKDEFKRKMRLFVEETWKKKINMQ